MDLIYGNPHISKKMFLSTRPKRIQTAVVWTVVFVIFFTSSVLLSAFHVSSRDENNSLQSAFTIFCLPATYVFGTAALASIAAIWYNYGVTSKLLRIFLLCIGIICICFYYVAHLIPYFLKHHLWWCQWCYNRPSFLIFPSILLTLGCKKKV